MRALTTSLFAALLLMSCGNGAERAERVEQPAEIGATPSVHFVNWTNIAAEQIIVAEGVSYTISEDAARISGVPLNAGAGGSTGAVGIRLPDSFEAEASGKIVSVTVRASSADENALIGIAYSTADVGNSGWQAFPLTSEPTDYTFTYDVPVLQAGNGDYLGFRSYEDDIVSVYGYSVSIIERPEGSASP